MGKQSQNIQLTSADEAFKLLQLVKNDPDHEVVFQFSIKKLPDYLTSQQVMDMIKCGRTHLHNLTAKGIIKKVRSVAGQNRYDRAEIQHLINEGLV